MDPLIDGLQYSPNKSLCRPAFSIFRLRVSISSNNPHIENKIKVFIHTNLGQAALIRAQLIQKVEEGFAHEWDFHDVSLRYNEVTNEYCLDYLLDQVGYFEWKLWAGSTDPKNPWKYWAPGPNHGISVFPASYKKENAIYCTFLRQFSKNKFKSNSNNKVLQENVNKLEEMGCWVIQPSGTFEEFKKNLPFIINKLGMKTIHFLPINPVPQSYGRMGKYGSPYASLDFFAIDSVYARFDRFRTIEEQFIDLTSTIHYLGGTVLLDIAINHTGWGSKISAIHPNWQVRKSNGEFISPGAWGTIWEDLVELDHSKQDLWVFLAQMFTVWCKRGVDGFRLDAGYMVPLSTWQYIISKVREEYPQTFFLLEGLGGAIDITKELLKKGMMNFAYSELFQNYSKEEINNYLTLANEISDQDGILVHYAETHDNNRLATQGKVYTLMRLCLSAFTSYYGSWGFTNGVEWLAEEKVNVHKSSALNWGSKNNLVVKISKINKILSENPCFWEGDNLQIINSSWPNICTFYRSCKSRSNYILILINIDCKNSVSINISLKDMGIDLPFEHPIEVVDLLNDTIYETYNSIFNINLTNGQVRVLRFQEKGKPYKLILLNSEKRMVTEIDSIYRIMRYTFREDEIGRIDQEILLSSWIPYRGLIAYSSTNNFEAFLDENFKDKIIHINKELLLDYSQIWTFSDKNKEFLIEGNKWLITSSELPASVFLDKKEIKTVHGDDGSEWAIFPPDTHNMRSLLTFHWSEISDGKIKRRWENACYPIYSLPTFNDFEKKIGKFNLTLNHSEILKEWTCVILANGRGTLLKTPLSPGQVHSKYDALLMANYSKNFPEDRVVLVKCSRDFIYVNNKTYELDARDCIQFIRYPVPTWRFDIKDGDSHFILTKRMHLVRHSNTTLIQYRCVEATESFILHVNFYLEWRSYHEESKAMHLEDQWKSPYTVCKEEIGFDFHPFPKKTLQVRGSRGEFAVEPKWIYNIKHPMDTTRGQEHSGDAYSPGYFVDTLNKGEFIDFVLTLEKTISNKNVKSAIMQEGKRLAKLFRKLPQQLKYDSIARSLIVALDQFIVKRDNGYTIIAGYPWFIDWGRDTLICIPGLISAGFLNEVEGILIELAHFTENGMVPNIIFGDKAGNYDTVDAPLWFFEAVRCYIEATNDRDFLTKTVKKDGKTMLDVLIEIVESFIKGTKNNIKIDKKTGLIFSPQHFTWMDTQHPAGTPREGYPIEIQGLWINSLRFLSNNINRWIDKKFYSSFAEQAEKSLWDLFWIEEKNYFADGIWTSKGESPDEFLKDTSLRPNQLILLYLNLVPQDKARPILKMIQKELVIPGAMRSLADKRIEEPLYIHNSSGELLCNPYYPFCGRYEGDEDSSRKPAYHNGTAWLWQYPYFVESLAEAYGNDLDAVQNALCFLAPSLQLLRQGAVGSLEEIQDGNYPHTPRGCFAQAWSVAELLRVYLKLRLKEIELKNVKS